ncbi:MAG: type IV secretory system conjugative DNA transfer family protein [archaeon]|nr:type IV secretory system conjugative DNA transfer family protein [archaeon]
MTGTRTDNLRALKRYVGGAQKTVSVPASEAPKRNDNSAQWADPEVFKGNLERKDLTREEYAPNSGGAPLHSDGKVCHVDPSDHHTLVIGSTGSKKSRLICMPMLDILARAGESVVVADPKGELYVTTGESFRSRGYKVHVLNFREFLRGDRWNPFHSIHKISRESEEGRELAIEMLMDLCNNMCPTVDTEDPFWEDMARALLYSLSSLLLFGSEDPGNVNIVQVGKMLETIFHLWDDSDAKDRLPSTELANGVRAVLKEPANTRACVVGMLQSKLWTYLSQRTLRDMMSGNDIEYGEFGHEKSVLFLIVPDEKTTYNGLVSILVQQMYEGLIREAQFCPGGTLPVRVNFVLDEFASFPRINQMQSMISASRSRNIRFTLVVQSVRQLKARYKGDAETIMENCLNWLFLYGRDTDFLDDLVKVLGEGEEGGGLVAVSRLQRLDVSKGEVLVLNARQDPIISNLADISCVHGIREPAVIPDRREILDITPLNLQRFFRDFEEEDDYVDQSEDLDSLRPLFERWRRHITSSEGV